MSLLLPHSTAKYSNGILQHQFIRFDFDSSFRQSLHPLASGTRFRNLSFHHRTCFTCSDFLFHNFASDGEKNSSINVATYEGLFATPVWQSIDVYFTNCTTVENSCVFFSRTAFESLRFHCSRTAKVCATVRRVFPLNTSSFFINSMNPAWKPFSAPSEIIKWSFFIVQVKIDLNWTGNLRDSKCFNKMRWNWILDCLFIPNLS